MIRPPTTFETTRLLLRMPHASDAAAIFKSYAQDAEVTRYLIWLPHKDIRETEDFLERAAAGWKAGSEYSWAITLKETDELIGMIGLRVPNFEAEIGYVLSRRWWGQGIMTEGVRPIVEWALDQPAIYRVMAKVDVANPASARVLEKVGMQREGLLRRSGLHLNISPEPRDSYCYAIVK